VGFFLVMKAEVVRSFIIMRRYWFATLTSMAIGYGMLIGLIYGFMYNRALVEEFASKATGTALGMIVGMFAFGIVGLFTQGLQSMARSGELEQVCMSPHGLITNFVARSFVGAVTSVLSLSVMLYLIAATVKGQIHAAPVPVAVLLALTYINLIGFGFMSGGLALIFKQTGQVAMLVRFGLLALAVGSSEKLLTELPLAAQWLLHILPVTDAAACLKLVMVKGIGSQIFTDPQYSFYLYCLIGNCILWNAIGIVCFKYMENYSRDKGTLGAY